MSIRSLAVVLALGVMLLFGLFALRGTDGAANNVAATDDGATQSTAEMTAAGDASVPQDPALPPDADGANDRIANSPRHGEWVMVPVGSDSIRSWVVYPERGDQAPVVLVVHEIYGLSNWVRAVADQVAAEGFIAIAPDLLTMKNPPLAADGEVEAQAARTLIRELERADVDRWLSGVAEWGMALPAARESYGIVGYCWGGSTSFAHAVAAPGLSASVVYYGGSPDTESLSAVLAPVLGLYGGEDARVNSTIPAADSAMKAMGKTYEYHIFEGAGHGFLRQQAGQDGANMEATRQAWPLTIEWFRTHLQ